MSGGASRGVARALRLGAGDLNGFVGLAVDNLSVLALLAALLVGTFDIPAGIVFGRMFPGTALGVLVGDLIYAILALRLARRSGRDDVTAMPFGMDTPSTIGMAVLVLGPAFQRFRAAGLDADAAGLQTWHLGMAATVVMGLTKLAAAFAGRAIQRVIPQAGLLGSLAGVAVMLIGFLPMVEMFQTPIVGLVTLGLILYALLAERRPGRVPSVLLSVVAGTALYYALRAAGLVDVPPGAPAPLSFSFSPPHLDIGLLEGFRNVADILPLIVPFALLTVIGGINNAESARVAGDAYDVRAILLGEAVATLAAGLSGGVSQTTPYIGHPAYKRMGARAGYVWLTGLFIGIGGMLGLVSNLVRWVPLAALAPVLVFTALNIAAQAFTAVPARHAAAVALAFFPSIARLLAIELGNPSLVPPERFAALMTAPGQTLPPLAVIVALGNGFIITGTLWAALAAALTDARPRAAAGYAATAGVLSLFGIIHSVHPDGGMYIGWHLGGTARVLALELSAAYFVLAACMAAAGLKRRAQGPAAA